MHMKFLLTPFAKQSFGTFVSKETAMIYKQTGPQASGICLPPRHLIKSERQAKDEAGTSKRVELEALDMTHSGGLAILARPAAHAMFFASSYNDQSEDCLEICDATRPRRDAHFPTT